MDRRIWIVIGILIFVGLGLLSMTTMTGNVITGSVAADDVAGDKYSGVGEFGNEDVRGVNNGEDSSGSG